MESCETNGGGGGALHGPLRPSGVDPEEVRRAYELTAETTASIRQRYRLTKRQFEVMRIRGGWTARPPAAPRGPGPLAGCRSIGLDALEYRLNRLLTVGMEMLEAKVAEAGFDEVRARTLTELCRAQEVMMRETRKQKATKAHETKNNDLGRDPAADIAFIRAELERRIEALGRRGGHGSGAEDAEGDTGPGASGTP
jgi:hypothetical protein